MKLNTILESQASKRCMDIQESPPVRHIVSPLTPGHELNPCCQVYLAILKHSTSNFGDIYQACSSAPGFSLQFSSRLELVLTNLSSIQTNHHDCYYSIIPTKNIRILLVIFQPGDLHERVRILGQLEKDTTVLK